MSNSVVQSPGRSWLASVVITLVGVGAALAVGYMSARLGGEIALAAVVGVLAALSPLLEPRILLFCVPPAIALSPELDIGGLPLRVEDLLLAPLAVGWLLRLVGGYTRWPQTPLTKPIFIVLLLELLSTVLGGLGGTTSLGVNTYSGTFFWLKSAEVFLMYFIATDTLRGERQVLLWAYLLALSGITLATQGMVQHIAAGDPNAFIPDPEGGPTYSLIALALSVIACLCISLLLMSKEPRTRALWAASLIPLGYSLAFSFSRQTYIGLGAALAFLTYSQSKRMLPYLVAIVVAVVVLVPDTVADRLVTIAQPLQTREEVEALTIAAVHESVYGTRLRAWIQHLPTVMRTNPLLGMGSAALPPGDLDSQYLALIYYNGLIGLAAFLWLLWCVAKSGWKLFHNENARPHIRALGLALTAATIGLAVSGLGGVPFVAIRARELYWFLAAVAMAALREVGKQDEE